MPFKITCIHAYIAVDDVGEEGLPAMRVGDQWFPLMAADERRLHNIKNWAAKLRAETGQDMKLVKFSHREDVEE